MREQCFSILSNAPVAPEVFRLVLRGETVGVFTAPGQFVNVRLPGFFLRRPFSVCRFDEASLTIIYKVVGEGTAALAAMQPGTELELLTGLGHGYDASMSGQAPLLIGGGVGIPPLYGLCEALLAQGKRPTVLLGFNAKPEVFLEAEFRALGVPVQVATVDGSYGAKGFVTDLLAAAEPYSFYYTCGPMPMLKAVHAAARTAGQLSLEACMGCGFGACMGCTMETKHGPKRICKEGPVLESEELLW